LEEVEEAIAQDYEIIGYPLIKCFSGEEKEIEGDVKANTLMLTTFR